MSNLKSKVGGGGLDPKVLAETQKSIEQTLQRDGQVWVDNQLEELRQALTRFSNPEDEKFESVSDLVCVALDLKSTALSINENQLGAIAKSMHILAETADIQDQKVKALLAAHVQTATACRSLNPDDSAAASIANQLVSELMAAAQQVTGA